MNFQFNQKVCWNNASLPNICNVEHNNQNTFTNAPEPHPWKKPNWNHSNSFIGKYQLTPTQLSSSSRPPNNVNHNLASIIQSTIITPHYLVLQQSSKKKQPSSQKEKENHHLLKNKNNWLSSFFPSSSLSNDNNNNNNINDNTYRSSSFSLQRNVSTYDDTQTHE